jgi:hypothetical protein
MGHVATLHGSLHINRAGVRKRVKGETRLRVKIITPF